MRSDPQYLAAPQREPDAAEVAVRRQAVIAAARDLFWRNGYAETSMADIVAATELNRYALYSLFDNKRDIFLAALADYFEEGRRTFEPLMRDSKIKPLERIRTGLEYSRALMNSHATGCFICHVAAIHAPGEPEVSRAVLEYFEKVMDVMKEPLREAQVDGSLNPALGVDEAAQLLFDADMSMGNHIRAGADEAVIDRIIRTTLAALGSKP